MHPTFRERYCAHAGIPTEQFEDHVFARTLYFHARPLRWLLNLVPDYFAADHDFIRSVGDLRSRRFFHAEAGEYSTHALNRGILRRGFLLRVSAERVRLLMEANWGTHDSAPPLDERPADSTAPVSSRSPSSHS